MQESCLQNVSPNSELQAATKDSVYVKRNPSEAIDGLFGSTKFDGGISVNSLRGLGSFALAILVYGVCKRASIEYLVSQGVF